MFVHPDAQLNGFRDVKIPSNAELFLQYGFKPSNIHPDNVNGKTWNLPSNLQGDDNLSKLSREVDSIFAEAESAMRPIQENPAQVEEANEDSQK